MSLATIAFALGALVCAWGFAEGLRGQTSRGMLLLAAGVASVAILLTAHALAFVVVVAAVPVLASPNAVDSGGSAGGAALPLAGWLWAGFAALGLAALFGSLGSRLYVTYGADVGPFAGWGSWSSMAGAAVGQQVLSIGALSLLAAVMLVAARRREP